VNITIKNKHSTGNMVSVLTDDGTDLGSNISAIDIKIRPDEIITATVEFGLLTTDIKAQLGVTESHLRELASHLGFDVVLKVKK
jgi:hypothetical protein